MAETRTSIHPLRQRMSDDMTLRGISPQTQKNYLRNVRSCCQQIGVKPGDLDTDAVRGFLLHLQRDG